MQLVNVVFWMLPHAVILSVSCSWFGVVVNVSGLIRWTMWNTVSTPSCCLLFRTMHHKACQGYSLLHAEITSYRSDEHGL